MVAAADKAPRAAEASLAHAASRMFVITSDVGIIERLWLCVMLGAVRNRDMLSWGLRLRERRNKEKNIGETAVYIVLRVMSGAQTGAIEIHLEVAGAGTACSADSVS